MDLRGDVVSATTDRAATWLRAYLGEHGGTATAAEVRTAGADAGHGERALRRAARLLGVRRVRVGFGGGSTYWLPPQVDQSEQGGEQEQGEQDQQGDEDQQQEQGRPAAGVAGRAWRVPVDQNLYGQEIGWVTTADPVVASHWDHRAWVEGLPRL
jgi:hypothetical protein